MSSAEARLDGQCETEDSNREKTTQNDCEMSTISEHVRAIARAVFETEGKTIPRHELAYDPIPAATLARTIMNAFYYYRMRKFVGTKSPRGIQNLVEYTYTDSYYWFTYTHVWDWIVRLGNALKPMVSNLQENTSRPFIGIYSPNCIEWVVTDMTCVLFDCISVPLAHTLDDDQLVYIINHASVSIVFVSDDLVPNLRRVLSRCPNVCYCIVFGNFSSMPLDEQRNESPNSSQSVSEQIPMWQSFDILLLDVTNLEQVPETADEDALMTLLYTSGSTGTPKGAMNSFRRWNSFITPLYLMPFPLVRVAFAPLAHTTERQLTWLTAVFGGRQAFASGDKDQLFDEFQLVKMTQLSAPPRLYDAMYSQFKAALEKSLFELYAADSFPSEQTIKALRTSILKQTKLLLGGHIQHLVIGGAASSSHLREFLEECFECQVFDGYGATEAGSIASNNVLFPNVEARLESVSEFGFTTDDKPYPRGEILVKTPQMISGYYKDERATIENFQDGWFRTGDIGEMRENGEIVIIDRCKNIFKMAQGVFVEPSRIGTCQENLLLQSKFIDQIYVHGDLTQSQLVAIVVPNKEMVQSWSIENNVKYVTRLSNISAAAIVCHQIDFTITDQKALLSDDRLRYHVMLDIASTSRAVHLPAHEVPATIYLEGEQFTPENKLLTISFKPLRRNLASHYKEIINRLYDELESSHFKQFRLRSILSSVVPMSSVDQESDLLSQVGGDSLSTVRLISILKDSYGEDISDIIFSGEEVSIKKLEERLLNETPSHLSRQEASESSMIWIQNDLNLSREVANSIPQFDHAQLHEEASNPHHILVTGATGFLGCFIVQELVYRTNATVIVIVRAEDEVTARQRFFSTCRQYEVSMSEAILRRVEVLAGDISKPNFDLGNQEFSSLCARVQLVIHSAAEVNWVKRYRDIRASNVIGTLNIIQFCSTTRVKYLSYISTISVLSVETWEPLPLQDLVHHSGYGQSKWIAEAFVRSAMSKGMPAVVHRPGMVAAHSSTGAGNIDDFTSRLVCGLVELGASFESNSLVEMIPVDWISSVIVASSMNLNISHDKFINYSNPHSPTLSYLNKLLDNRGHHLNILSYPNWRELLIARSTKSLTRLFPLLSYFGPVYFDRTRLASRESLNDILTSLQLNECPPADELILLKFFAYLQRRRLLFMPE